MSERASDGVRSVASSGAQHTLELDTLDLALARESQGSSLAHVVRVHVLFRAPALPCGRGLGPVIPDLGDVDVDGGGEVLIVS